MIPIDEHHTQAFEDSYNMGNEISQRTICYQLRCQRWHPPKFHTDPIQSRATTKDIEGLCLCSSATQPQRKLPCIRATGSHLNKISACCGSRPKALGKQGRSQLMLPGFHSVQIWMGTGIDYMTTPNTSICSLSFSLPNSFMDSNAAASKPTPLCGSVS